jgi:hypothetical protein
MNRFLNFVKFKTEDSHIWIDIKKIAGIEPMKDNFFGGECNTLIHMDRATPFLVMDTEDEVIAKLNNFYL